VLQGFIVVGILFASNVMASAFYTKYALIRFHAGVNEVATFTSVLMAATVVANLTCGWVGDLAGNKRLLELGLAAGIVAPLVAWAAPSAAWLLLVFALNQVAVTSWGIAQINYVLELCGPERAATYSAVAGLMIGPFRAGTPLLGAWLVQTVGYGPLFGISGALTLVGLAVSSRWVMEPRARGTGVQMFGGPGAEVSQPERLNA